MWKLYLRDHRLSIYMFHLGGFNGNYTISWNTQFYMKPFLRWITSNKETYGKMVVFNLLKSTFGNKLNALILDLKIPRTWLDLGHQGLIVHRSNLVVTWKVKLHMGFMSLIFPRVTLVHPWWLYFVFFLQFSFQIVPNQPTNQPKKI